MADDEVLKVHGAAFRAARRKGRLAEDALDVAQEVALRALQASEDVGPAWGTKAARWLLVDGWRRHSVELKHQPRVARDPAIGVDLLEDLAQAELVVSQAAEAVAVRAAVAMLPLSARLVIEAELAGFTRLEVAASLGITPEAARTRAYRGRRILEGLLG